MKQTDTHWNWVVCQVEFVVCLHKAWLVCGSSVWTSTGRAQVPVLDPGITLLQIIWTAV